MPAFDRDAVNQHDVEYMLVQNSSDRHAFSHVIAGDPTHRHNGKRVLVCHFITDRGPPHMVDVDGRAVMYDGTTNKPIAEINAA